MKIRSFFFAVFCASCFLFCQNVCASTPEQKKSVPANKGLAADLPQDQTKTKTAQTKTGSVAFEDKTFTLKERLEIDPSTGSMTASVPFEVPSGRAGVQPTLSLLYNSHGSNSIAGVGWAFELGCIRRSVKSGIPGYSNSDSFILVQSGSQQELAYDSSAGFYRAKLEGTFMKFEFLPNQTWTVTDKKGTKYYFGTNAASQVYDTVNSNRIFQWSLDRVEDLSGNYMTISYIKADNQLYPSQINYTGNSVNVLTAFAHVDFSYEVRLDELMMYAPGFKIETKKRLKAVDIFVGPNRVRKYVLQYAQSPETNRSRLVTVTQYGSDGVTGLPPTTFAYSDGQMNIGSPHMISNYPNDHIGNGLSRVIDINNDGLPDLIRSPNGGDPYQIFINNGNWNFNPVVYTTNNPPEQLDPNKEIVDLNGDGLPDIIFGQTPTYKIWLNNGANNFLPAQNVSHSPSIPLSDTNVRLVDMNGDGFPDLVQFSNSQYKIYLNNGSGDFQSPFNAANPPPETMANGNVKFADFNGDGLLDIMYGEYNQYRIWINNGTTGFHPPSTVSHFPNGLWLSNALVQLADMNGDGLADLLVSTAGNNQPYYIYYNNGKVDFDAPIPAVNPPVRGTDNSNTKLIDMNGDGLTDVFIGQISAGVPYQVSLNNGRNGFFPPVVMSNYPNADLDDYWNMLVDFNKDGLTDFMRGTVNEPPYKVYPHAYGAQAVKADLLVSMDNSIGGQTAVEYAHALIVPLSGSQYKFAHSPILFPVVKKTRASVSGENYVTNYSFQGGLWDFPEREFRGFAMTKVIDPDGNYTQSYFLQDDIYKGKTSRQETYDAANNLFGKTVNTWNNAQICTGVHFVYLEQVDNFIYDGNATGRRTQEKYFYAESPQYGNLTKTVQMGEVDLATGADVGSDSRTTEATYHNNISGTNWLLGIPKQVTVKDNTGNEARKTWFYYDGSTNLNTLPIKGQLTKKELWGGNGLGAVNPVTEYTHDAYGNLLTTKDPNNHISSVTYDATYHMFPLIATNAKGHSVVKEYYGVNGVALDDGIGYHGLWGQVRSVKDPNGQQAKKTYDTFGRLAATVSPFDSLAFPTSSVEYAFLSTGVKVVTHQRENHGQSGTIDSTSFYDGMGRLIQSKSESGLFGQFVVSGQTEYNSRGLPVKKYVSFFSLLPVDTLEAISQSRPHTTIAYDAMGRVVQTANPDGSYNTVIYDDWITTSVDENGHRQSSRADAYGRLVEKKEYFGADGRDSHYPSQPYTLYAATQYFYDSEGNLTQVQDAHNNITTILYDKLGRKVSMSDPDMGHWEYRYDPVGNLIWQKDAKNQEITFTYDEINRLVNKTDGGALDVDYSYDSNNAPIPHPIPLDQLDADTPQAVLKGLSQVPPIPVYQNYGIGRLTAAKYTTADRTSFVYDVLGREKFSAKKIDGVNYFVNRAYDAASRLTQLVYPDNSIATYTYNSAGQISTISSSAQTVVSDVQYNASGQVTKVEYGNGTMTTYTYDPYTFRLTNLTTVNSQGQALQNFYYTYDGVGNILTITDNVNTATQSFVYDALSRLTRAQGSYGIKTYSYDEIGNILSKEGISYAYSQIGAGPHAVTALSDGTTFGYDANGNMVQKADPDGTAWAYTYDAENRLKGVKKNNVPAAVFAYDGDGGRVKKTVYSGLQSLNDAQLQKKAFFDLCQFGADSNDPGGGKDLIAIPPLAPQITTKYIGSLYELDNGSAIRYVYLGSTRIAQVRNGQVMYYHGDHLGGANVLTDSTGAVKELCEYLPFGGFSRHEKYGNAQEVAHFYFSGKEVDDKTGLYYYGARYYNPLIGRFLTPDTIVQSPGGNPQTLNRYTYCNNNPVNLIDPTGHSWFSKLWSSVAGGLIGAAVGVLSGNPWLGFAAYNAFSTAMAGGNIGAAMAGAVAGYLGGAIIGNLGNFWGTLGGGAVGGAAGAGTGGGDVGRGALAGLGGSWAGYSTGAMSGLAGLGTIVGGGVGSEIAGGEFGDGALGGLGYNLGYTVGSTIASWSYQPANTASISEDSQVFFAGARIGKESEGFLGKVIGGAFSMGMAILDPGPFNHTAVGAGGSTVIDSHPDRGELSGPNVRDVKTFEAFQSDRVRIVQRNSGLTQTANSLRVSLQNQQIHFSLPPFSSGGIFCSQFTGRALHQANSGVYGIGPNSQAWW